MKTEHYVCDCCNEPIVSKFLKENLEPNIIIMKKKREHGHTTKEYDICDKCFKKVQRFLFWNSENNEINKVGKNGNKK